MMTPEDIDKALKVITSWAGLGDVDQALLESVRGHALMLAIRQIRSEGDHSAMYRIVIEATQHGTMGIHLETVKSHEDFVKRFREVSNSSEEKSDEEIYNDLGSWYFDSYGYNCYDWNVSDYSDKLMDAEREFWEGLEDWPDGEEFYQNASIVNSILHYESTSDYAELLKTDDCIIRFYDGNCHEWAADQWLVSRRAKI